MQVSRGGQARDRTADPPLFRRSIPRLTSAPVKPAGIAAFCRRADIGYAPLQDVAARMVVFAYGEHRTTPELGQLVELATSMLASRPDPETMA